MNHPYWPFCLIRQRDSCSEVGGLKGDVAEKYFGVDRIDGVDVDRFGMNGQ